MDDWWWLLWYGIGVPIIAAAVSVWWLAHFMQAFMQAERSVCLDEPDEPNWSFVRKWLFLASGLPLIPVGARLMSWLSPKLSCSGYTLIALSCLKEAPNNNFQE